MIHDRLYYLLVILLTGLSLGGCSGSDSSPPNASDGSTKYANVVVTGAVTYEDKLYGARGFTGDTSYKSIRYAAVDLVDSAGNVIATTYTDETGNYSLSGAGKGLYVRVLALTSTNAGSTIAIRNHSGDAYAITRSLDGAEGELNLNMAIGVENTIAGVFNMLDVFTNASLFLNSLSTMALPELGIYWQPASSQYGTYFCPSMYKGGSCPQGKGIYILGGSSSGGDTDEFDDDVLMHEYGHYVELSLGAKDSPGGTHYLTDNDHDLRLAWSEGWGGFFPIALKTWLRKTNDVRLSTTDGLADSYFIDTYGSFASISINMAAPNAWFCPGGIDCFIYSSSEIAVANILSKLQDEYGVEAVWNVYANYMAHSTSAPATLETFWDGWKQQRAPAATELGVVNSILMNREVFFQQDEFEQDDTLATARPLTVCHGFMCSAEKHYLYKDSAATDIDMYRFSVTAGQTYAIQTQDLGNGADTYIRLLDASGNVVYNSSGEMMVNDDRPGTTYCYTYDNPCRIHYDDVMLSSSLTFTPDVSGTYYVEVSSSPDRPVGSGRYGTYSISITR